MIQFNTYTFSSRCLVCLIVYCTVGMAYRYRVKEARGREVVPNAAFWREAPLLVKVQL